MGFTAETRSLAPQKQLILSWAASLLVRGALARPSKGTRGGSALMRCGSNSQEKTLAMLAGHAQPPFTRTGFADLALLHGMTRQRERLRSMRL